MQLFLPLRFPRLFRLELLLTSLVLQGDMNAIIVVVIMYEHLPCAWPYVMCCLREDTKRSLSLGASENYVWATLRMVIKTHIFSSSLIPCDFSFPDLSSLPVKRRCLYKAMFKDSFNSENQPIGVPQNLTAFALFKFLPINN